MEPELHQFSSLQLRDECTMLSRSLSEPNSHKGSSLALGSVQGLQQSAVTEP